MSNQQQQPLIYAELLATLRQVSLHITFPSPITSSSTLHISGPHLTLTHASLKTTLLLPSAVRVPSSLPLAPGSLQAHFKLPLAPSFCPPVPVHAHPDAPWDSCDLHSAAGVFCRSCAAQVVPPGTVRVWKDLPSENWAEMMEFWHCHKPYVPVAAADEQEKKLAQRAYGADATIAAQQGVGFVDLTSFLFAEDDVKNVQFAHPSPAPSPSSTFARPAPVPIFCSSCSSRLGSHDAHHSSIVLFKWLVTTASAVAPPSSTVCLAASLLAGMSRSGYAKSILLPSARTISSTNSSINSEENNETLLFVWIMNPNTVYSASGAAHAQPAIRIMYKFIHRPEALKMLNNAASDVHEVVWPREAIAEAVAALDRGFDLMPPEARSFQDWKVSMFDKWHRP
ncbi:hypothetical protein TD95_000002 [Thielaviopsis punctulata]|uniref:Ubiquitin-conjugating enzyme E2-binding protein n=1 Tax=Thielaviopsis punctulata TaxID=72032 RepID=A0A0F4Z8W1_9PEZI|nr:hypothetical protein TD95_000002 [Thielaviopsis punctulata]